MTPWWQKCWAWRPGDSKDLHLQAKVQNSRAPITSTRDEEMMMKSMSMASILLTGLAMLLQSGIVLADENQLSVYNWSDYIAHDTVHGFEKQTGIKVKYDVFDSDDTLQTKLLTGKTGYDLVVPSATALAKQIEAGIYQKLDKSKIPNLAHLDKGLMQLVATADPGNQYAVPWAWGTDGLGYNLTRVKAVLGNDVALDSWDVFFDVKNLSKLQKCGVSILDQPSEIFPITLHYLHKDPNSRNPTDYMAALDLLKKLRPHITQFNSSGYINDLANGDVCVALGWSGDVNMAKHRAMEAGRNYQIAYVIPKEGTPVWFDMMAIPKDAPHPENAMKWINYIQIPEVNAAITNEVFYPTANVPARKLVRADVGADPTIYPSEQTRKTLFALKPTPNDIARLENRLWAQLKTGR